MVCIREVQKTLNQSAKALIEAKIHEYGVGSQSKVMYDRIESPGGDHLPRHAGSDAESIKSLEGYDFAWVEEAQTLSKKRPRHAPTNTPNRQQRVLMESFGGRPTRWMSS